MMCRWLKVWWVLMAVSMSLPAYAVKLDNLYEAEVSVPSQAADARSAAIQEGLLTVLIKITGNQAINTVPLIKTNLKRADYYVQEYGYSQPTVNSSTYTLKIRFDKDDVDRLLKQAGVVTWGETRPLVMVWLSVTDADHQATIIGGETPGPILDAMKKEGNRYGLPLIFPVMDMTETNQITPDQINLASLSLLTSVSQRYAPDAMLIAQIQPSAAGFDSQWTLTLRNQQWGFKISAASLQEVMTTAMHQVSQTLSENYLVKNQTTKTQWITLNVNGVSADNDLEQVMKYLKQLSPVQQVELASVNGDSVQLRVLINSDIPTFEKNASIGQQLQLSQEDLPGARLTYNWVHP